MIEASADQIKGAAEKEWYFGNVEKERRGPYSFPEVWDSVYYNILRNTYLKEITITLD